VKNMGKYQAWDGGQFAVAAPSGTMVAQNVVSGIAPDDMTVVMARGEVELALYRLPTGTNTTGARASGRVQAPAQPAGPGPDRRPIRHDDAKWAQRRGAGRHLGRRNRRRRGSPGLDTDGTDGAADRLEPRTKRRLRKGDVIALQLVAESSESVQVNIAYSGFLGLFTTEP